MNVAAPGAWVTKTKSFGEMDFSGLRMDISTDRYTSREFQEREREQVWMKAWQVVGRADELANAGDWKEYRILDQSFIVARGKDGKIRGFVNSCRHRGNALCHGKGNSPRLVCQYHLWTYGLDGKLIGVARPDLVGPLDKSEHGLIEVSVDCFAGFVFLNPDPEAAPLSESLGEEVRSLLGPYKLDEMVPVGMDVREALDCNWKVVIDAFSEGYHIVGVHPELLRVIELEAGNSRYGFFGDHSFACAPFDVKNVDGFGPEDQIQGIR